MSPCLKSDVRIVIIDDNARSVELMASALAGDLYSSRVGLGRILLGTQMAQARADWINPPACRLFSVHLVSRQRAHP